MIYTIGHSTRTADELVALLQVHGIERLADVRAAPASRRYPHFNRDVMSSHLAEHGVTYRHLPALGGLRKPRADSTNTGWKHPGFRGYADYMETDDFQAGLQDLLTFGHNAPTAVMCAEALWWKCHRRLIADALVALQHPVRHILNAGTPSPHEMSDFATVRAGRVIYPALL